MVPGKDKKDIEGQWMHRLGIHEEDILEKFVLGSGSGGQKINKTSSCVYLKHLPTGIEIKCQQDRSREVNRGLARLELCRRIQALKLKEKMEKQYLKEKARRQNRRPSAAQKEKIFEQKQRHSQKKAHRKKSYNLE